MLALINATLIDGTGAAPRQGEKVLLDGNKIAAVGRYILIPEGSQVIDLKGMILMPGLIDVHAHVGDHPFLDGNGLDSAERSDNYAQMRKLALSAGITTVRSCGDYMHDTAAVREMIRAGRLAGPRIICSGKTFMRSDSHPATTVWAGDQATVDNCGAYPSSPEDGREMVREAVDAGMDFIKIVIGDTHIMLWPEKFKQLEPEIIQAIIEEAHKYNRPVACHVDHLPQAKLAVQYGADEIHHLIAIGTPYYELPEYASLFTDMCEKGTWLVPTLAVPRVFEAKRLAKNCPTGGIDYSMNVFRMAYEYGVSFGMGCDSGCPGVPWGKSLWGELAEYVYSVGMTPLEAIRCATAYNARMTGMETQIGTIRVGAFADLLVLEKNPVEDIGNFDSVCLVLRDGAIVVDNHGERQS